MQEWHRHNALRDGTYTFKTRLPKDAAGMIGRECPSSDCERYFKVKPGTGIPDNQTMYCPYCARPAPSDHFYTKAQIEYGRSKALREVADALHAELTKLERHSFRSGFVSMEIKVKRGVPPPIRSYVEHRLEEQVICDGCRCEYAIYGLFAVCPDCGQHNVFIVLHKNLDIVRRQATFEASCLADPSIDSGGALADNIRDFGPRMVESACEDLVTAFEACFKELNQRCSAQAPTAVPNPSGNLFQRLDGTRDWFARHFGADLFDGLPEDELTDLRTLFNKRHVLTHNLGLIDESYIKRTGGDRQDIGRKVRVTADEVERCVDVVTHIATTAEAALRLPVDGAEPPVQGDSPDEAMSGE